MKGFREHVRSVLRQPSHMPAAVFEMRELLYQCFAVTDCPKWSEAQFFAHPYWLA